jgi:Fe-S cluster assembly ATP-binding protein
LKLKNYLKLVWKVQLDNDISMLEIKNLHASVADKKILNGLELSLLPGKVYAIMGPNGAGKSTLASVLAGKPDYEVLEGTVYFKGKNLLEMEPEHRAAEGLFLSHQYPVEIPGVSMMNFMKTAVQEIRNYKGLEPLSAKDFLALAKEKQAMVSLDTKLAGRMVNVGFSGGEKKRNEVFQMAMLMPDLAILDETDSGLDIDALRAVADGVNKLRDKERTFLIITHYQRLLDYITPDVVMVLMDGKIVKQGGPELALELENRGYDWIKQIESV